MADATLPVCPGMVELSGKSSFVSGGVQRSRMHAHPAVRKHLESYAADEREELLRDLEHGVGVRDIDPAYLSRITSGSRRSCLKGRRLRNAKICEDHLPFALKEVMSKVSKGAVR
jgi:hypothetical protein